MKKNVNFGLVLLLLATIICLMGLTIYHDNMTTSLEKQLKISNADYNLLLKKYENINKTYNDLLTDESYLNGKYTFLIKIKQEIEDNLTRLTNELDLKQQDLMDCTIKKGIVEVELDLIKKEYNALKLFLKERNFTFKG